VVARIDVATGKRAQIGASIDSKFFRFDVSPDGRRFASVGEGRHEHLVVQSLVDDSRQEFLAADPSFKRLDGWSEDGRLIVYERLYSATKWDVWGLPVDGSGPPLVHSRMISVSCRSPSGLAAVGLLRPLTTMAFKLLEPITAPKPPEPLASSSARRLAKSTPFSPAGPQATTLTELPSSLFRVSRTSKIPLPQRAEASLSSVVSFCTKR
jgi:hypothetical protein